MTGWLRSRLKGKGQGGFGLIEVMVMLVLIAIAGTATMSASSQSTHVATQAQALDAATQYANGIIERARSVPYLSLGMPAASCPAGTTTDAADKAKAYCNSVLTPATTTAWTPDPTPLKAGAGAGTTFSASTTGCLPDPQSVGMYAACGKEIVASGGTKLVYDVHLSVSWMADQDPTNKPGADASASYMGTKRVTVRMVKVDGSATSIKPVTPVISTFSGTRTALLGDAVPGGVNVAAVAATTPAGRANLALGPASVGTDGSTTQTLALNWSTIAALSVFTGTSPGNLYSASNSTTPAATVNVGSGTGSTTVDLKTPAGAAAPCYWGRFSDSAGRVGFTPVVCGAQLVPISANATTVAFAASPVADSQLRRWASNPGATGGCVDTSAANSTAVSGSAISATGLTANTLYYFQVTGTNGAIAVCSNIVAVRTAPAAPSISAFVTGKNVSATSAPRDASATWSAAPGATSYTLQYSADPTFATATSVVVNASTATATNGASASAKFSLLGSAQRYYLRVMATTAVSPVTTTAWSASANAYVELSAPVLTVAVTAGTYNLDASWPAVPGATGYRLEWGTSSTLAGATTVFPTCTTSSCSYRITVPTGVTRQYYARVTATVDSLSASSAIVAAQSAQTIYSCPNGGVLTGASTDPSSTCYVSGYYYGASYYSYQSGGYYSCSSGSLSGSLCYVSYSYYTEQIPDPRTGAPSGRCSSGYPSSGVCINSGSYFTSANYTPTYSGYYYCPSGGSVSGSSCYMPPQNYVRGESNGNGTRTYP